VEDTPGSGPLVKRHQFYRIRLRAWLNGGQPIQLSPMGLLDEMVLLDQGATLITTVRIDRVDLINGLFYGVEGMRIGGTRKLKISPHLAYGARGVPDMVPPNSVFLVEITVLEGRNGIVSDWPPILNGVRVPYDAPISSLRELVNSGPLTAGPQLQHSAIRKITKAARFSKIYAFRRIRTSDVLRLRPSAGTLVARRPVR
jgi:hypothetical protein